MRCPSPCEERNGTQKSQGNDSFLQDRGRRQKSAAGDGRKRPPAGQRWIGSICNVRIAIQRDPGRRISQNF